MDLEAIEKLVELMRRMGVSYIKTPELELVLGQAPLREQPQPKPVNITDSDPTEPRQTRLSSLYDSPSLKWPGGSRPQLGE